MAARSDFMDGLHFDRLTRRVGALLTRRRLGPVLILAGLGGSLAPGDKSLAKKRKKKKKKSGGGCKPACASKACGADDGCGDPCQTGSCPPTQTCRDGECVSTACDPPCPVDRPCSQSQGKCTCSADFQCARDRDPEGFDCLNSVTNPFCGCRPFTGQNRRVCVAGEPCSVCCADEECQAAVPDLPDIVCTSLPLNTLIGRACCVPHEGLCGGNNHCCSGSCVGSACGCLATGANCGAHEACCSNQCGTQANPFKCM
jgi:hypothetical protein